MRHNRMADRESDHLAVRVGLHVGEAVREEDDYFGTPVVIAKRLCDCGTGGQILASELVREPRRLPRRLPVRRGRAEARSRASSEPIVAVRAALGGRGSPARATRRDRPPRDPAGRDGHPISGRSRTSSRAPPAGECRTVLVLGEPGVGKTRIVTELLDATATRWSGSSARGRTRSAPPRRSGCGPRRSSATSARSTPRRSRAVRSVRGRPRGDPAERGARDAAPRRLAAAPARCWPASARCSHNLSEQPRSSSCSTTCTSPTARRGRRSATSRATSPARRILFVLTARPVELGEHRDRDRDRARPRAGRPAAPAHARAARPRGSPHARRGWFDADRGRRPLVDWLLDRSRGHLAVRGRAPPRPRRRGRRPRASRRSTSLPEDLAAAGARAARAAATRRAARCSSSSRSSATG